MYENKQTITADGKTFSPGTSWLVPTNQPQFKLVKTIFEKTLSYEDSIFYDITAWTFPLAMNIPYTELKTMPALGNAVIELKQPDGKIIGNSTYAYAFEWDDFYAPKVLYALQRKGIITKVASLLFESSTYNGNKKFNYGTIVLPVKIQNHSAEEMKKIIEKAIEGTGVQVYGLSTGLSVSGIDLGSGSLSNTKTPKILLIGGNGSSSNDVGEIWHLLDQRMKIPVTIVETDRLNAIGLNSYNCIIMPEGQYNTMDKPIQEKLRSWIGNGGALLAFENAGKFLATNGITKTIYKSDEIKNDSTATLPYNKRVEERRSLEIPGSIFEAIIDTTHPLCYGYRGKNLSVFKANTLFMDQNNNPYDSPVLLTNSPLQCGYLHRSQMDKLKGTAIVNIENIGRGKVITFSDNMCFRAFWFGTNKLLINALFF
jgi:hypothetical protein